MPNKNTIAVLDDLKKAGFDTSSFEHQIKVNPLLDKQADSIIGGGVLRRQEFTSFKEQKENEVATLKSQVQELAAAHDSLEHFKDNKELYEAALEKIVIQEENLISAGFTREDVESLTYKEKKGLEKLTSKATTIEEEKNMPAKAKEKDDSNFITTEDLNTVGANIALGGTISSIEIQFQIDRARNLGIEVGREQIEKFKKAAYTGLQNNKSWDEVADEAFGINAKLAEKSKADNEKVIEEETRKRVAEAMKDVPGYNPNQKTYAARTVVSNIRSRELPEVEGAGGTRVFGGKKFPVNKDGDVEFHKLRSGGIEGRPDRVSRAAGVLNTMLDKNPDLIEDL